MAAEIEEGGPVSPETGLLAAKPLKVGWLLEMSTQQARGRAMW